MKAALIVLSVLLVLFVAYMLYSKNKPAVANGTVIKTDEKTTLEAIDYGINQGATAQQAADVAAFNEQVAKDEADKEAALAAQRNQSGLGGYFMSHPAANTAGLILNPLNILNPVAATIGIIHSIAPNNSAACKASCWASHPRSKSKRDSCLSGC
jgi:hypothetical protein